MAYAAAMAASSADGAGRPVANGSIAAAIIGYQRSTEFGNLAPSTAQQAIASQQDQRHLGHCSDGRFTQHRYRGRPCEATPAPANNRRKTWPGLCAWAKRQRLIARDPSSEVEKPQAAKSDGFAPWTPDEIAAFRKYWPVDTPQRLAMELIFRTAARASDAVRLGPGMVTKDGWLTFRHVKTGGEVSIPYARSLPEFACGMGTDLTLPKSAIAAAPRHMTWLVTAHGKARSVKTFSSWFAGAAAAAVPRKVRPWPAKIPRHGIGRGGRDSTQDCGLERARKPVPNAALQQGGRSKAHPVQHGPGTEIGNRSGPNWKPRC